MKAKPPPWSLLVALGLFAAFVVAYQYQEQPKPGLVTPENARKLPAIIPPQPAPDDEASRHRQAHQQRLMEIFLKDQPGRVGRTGIPPGPDGMRSDLPQSEPVLPDPARPVTPLEAEKSEP